MGLEIKRMIRTKFFVVFLLLNLLNVVLGYTLLVAVDHLPVITFRDMFVSVYTAYTQFGALMFSPLIVMQFYMDYKDKNILFYKTLDFSEIKYFCSKICVIFFTTLLGSSLSSICICVPYAEMKLLPIVFLKIESVMLYYTLLLSILGFLFNNFLFAFFVNIFLWIGGVLIASSASFMRYFAYYDSSTYDFQYLVSFLNDEVSLSELLHQIAGNYLFDFVLFVICIAIVWLLRRRWIKNGV